jgi:hypothetical protein
VISNNKKKSKWKFEYEDTVFKLYDWNSNLAGYFFPNYDLNQLQKDPTDSITDQDNQSEAIERSIKLHQKVNGGNLLLPMLKLDLLDKEDGLDIDSVLLSLNQSVSRAEKWKAWVNLNAQIFKIDGLAVYTAREDRNMLSIVLGVSDSFILGEKELLEGLGPLLDKLNDDGLL